MSNTGFDAFMNGSAYEANDELFSEAVLFDMEPPTDSVSTGQFRRGSKQGPYIKRVSFQPVL